MAETAPTQGDLLTTNPALVSIIHVEHLRMCSKHTGLGFLLLPPPHTAFKDICQIRAWQRNREPGHQGGAGSSAPMGPCQLASKGLSAAAPRRALKARVSSRTELSAGRRGL